MEARRGAPEEAAREEARGAAAGKEALLEEALLVAALPRARRGKDAMAPPAPLPQEQLLRPQPQQPQQQQQQQQLLHLRKEVPARGGNQVEVESKDSPYESPAAGADEEDAGFLEPQAEAAPGEDVFLEVDASRALLSAPLHWYADGAQLGGAGEFVAVRDSSAALDVMREARASLDAILAQHSGLLRAGRSEQAALSRPLAASRALSGCRDAGQVSALLGAGELELPAPAQSAPAAASEAGKALAAVLGTRTVRVNHGASRAASDARGVARAVQAQLLAVGGESLPVARLTAVVRQLLVRACLADEALCQALAGPGSMPMASALSMVAAAGASERPKVLAALAERCGDVEVRVGAALHDGQWTPGVRVEGRGVAVAGDLDLSGAAAAGRVTLGCSLALELSAAALSRAAAQDPAVPGDTLDDADADEARRVAALTHATLTVRLARAQDGVGPLAEEAAEAAEEVSPESYEPEEARPEEAAARARSAPLPRRALAAMRRDVPRLGVRRPASYAGSVQVLAWGRNEQGVLGTGSREGRTYGSPGPAPLWGMLELTRVSKLSCGWSHCVALTDAGLVWTWGAGAEGALGHGDDAPCELPRLVAALAGEPGAPGAGARPRLAVDVGAGADLQGSHSICATREGEVFTWGVGHALGLRDAKARALPALVDPDDLGGERVDCVAAGGSFCVAVAASGALFSWGSWQHGRLGQGAPEARVERGVLFNRRPTRQATQRFRLRPRRVRGALDGAEVTAVACGEAHCLALDKKGRLFAWGRGSEGQLGTGSLSNAPRPVLVLHALGAAQGELRELPALAQVACGARHSLALGAPDAALYTWGGLGGPQLGHGAAGATWSPPRGAALIGDRAARSGAPAAPAAGGQLRPEDEVEDQAEQAAQAGVPLEDAQPWRWPRRVAALEGTTLACAAGGVRHSAAVVAGSGELYVWGTVGGGSDDGTLSCSGSNSNARMASSAEPRLAAQTAGLRAEAVACGGYHAAALVCGAEPARDLLSALLRLRRSIAPGGDAGLDLDALPDLQLRVGTRRLYAHRVVVGARSAVLRRMIELEGQAGDEQDKTAQLVQLTLPELSPDAAAVLLDFLYGDNVFSRLDPMGSTADELLQVAADFGLPRLEALCARAQASLPELDQEDELDDEDNDEGMDEEGSGGKAEGQRAAALQLRSKLRRRARTYRQTLLTDESLLGSSFSKDLQAFVNEPTWADLLFVCDEGSELFAHAVVVCARSERLAATVRRLRDGSRAAEQQPQLRVPLATGRDSALRMLAFLYGGELLAGTEQELLADLDTAHRYALAGWLRRAADALEPSAGNALLLLQTAERLAVASLKERALHFIALHLSALSQTKAFLRLQQRSPATVALVAAHARRATAALQHPDDDPGHQLRRALRLDEKEERERLEKENARISEGLPVPQLSAAVAALFAYSTLMSQPELIGLVPYANAAALVVVAIIVATQLSS
jgi:alpha-tubulin suppressor-like RCC1 family protein